ncbi:hypothetical protein O9929_21455 [Vibrio lentus]|nr:hypothetical protein [Vibrio lentus]
MKLIRWKTADDGSEHHEYARNKDKIMGWYAIYREEAKRNALIKHWSRASSRGG